MMLNHICGLKYIYPFILSGGLSRNIRQLSNSSQVHLFGICCHLEYIVLQAGPHVVIGHRYWSTKAPDAMNEQTEN